MKRWDDAITQGFCSKFETALPMKLKHSLLFSAKQSKSKGM